MQNYRPDLPRRMQGLEPDVTWGEWLRDQAKMVLEMVSILAAIAALTWVLLA